MFIPVLWNVSAQDSVPSSPVPPDTDHIASWLKKVETWDSRRTGGPDHRACIDWMAQEFEAMGLTTHRDEHAFSYWDLSHENVQLSIIAGDERKTVHPSAAYPFSGLTDQKGVTAPLVFVPGKRYGRVQGKIAVVEVPNKAIPRNGLFDIHAEFPKETSVLPGTIYNPVLSGTLFGPDLPACRKAGALGVIAVWKNMSPGMAAGQYVPFTLPYQFIPAVWLAGDDGRQVLDAAKKSATARLIMHGTLDTTAKAATVWTMIQGTNTGETVLVISHTDGTNPVEENGIIGLLSLAKRLSARGKKPQRTVIFIAVAGHLRLPDIAHHKKEQATNVWLREHPELWDGKKGHPKAVAGLVLEHLGAMEWADTKNGYVRTGKPEIEVVYATTLAMQAIVKKQWRSRTVPFRSSIVTPRSIRHLGEGEPLYKASIPTVALLGIPSYLLCELKSRGPGITTSQASSLVNADLAKDQCHAAYNILIDLTTIPSNKFGKVQHVGFFGTMSDLFRMAKVIMARE